MLQLLQTFASHPILAKPRSAVMTCAQYRLCKRCSVATRLFLQKIYHVPSNEYYYYYGPLELPRLLQKNREYPNIEALNPPTLMKNIEGNILNPFKHCTSLYPHY